jgi:hypothetical protein
VSDLSELVEQLADGLVLLVTAFDSVNADCDNGTGVSHTLRPRGWDGGAYRRLAAVAGLVRR